MGLGVENLLGLIASTISFVMWLPQARSTWRHRNSPTELAGISMGTQLLVLVNATVWGIYAVITGAYWSGAPGLVNLPLALLNIYLITRARQLSADVEPSCRCDMEGEHMLFITARPAYGDIVPCTGQETSGIPVPVGTRFDRALRTLVFPEEAADNTQIATAA